MKFPTLALCLAGTLVASTAVRADHDGHKKHSDTTMNQGAMDRAALRKMYRNSDASVRDPYTGVSIHAGEHLYNRDVLFPELQDEREVARQVSEIVSMQQHEVAQLNALAPRAQTAGYENISHVFEHLAGHHTELAAFGSSWLSSRGYAVPAAPADITVADTAPEITVQQQIAAHQQMLDHALMMRKQSSSSTVRGMLLWGATSASQHLSLLRTLDRDVDLGRKTASATLRMQMATPGTTTASSTELVEQYVTEERTLFVTEETTVAEVQPEPVIEQPVVEAPTPDAPVAEAPTPTPAPAPVVTQPVDTTIRPQTVPDNGAVTAPATQVLGRRQMTRSQRVRARRAAH